MLNLFSLDGFLAKKHCRMGGDTEQLLNLHCVNRGIRTRLAFFTWDSKPYK
jgi:hypothetical protein